MLSRPNELKLLSVIADTHKIECHTEYIKNYTHCRSILTARHYESSHALHLPGVLNVQSRDARGEGGEMTVPLCGVVNTSAEIKTRYTIHYTGPLQTKIRFYPI